MLPKKDHLTGRLETAGVTTYCLSRVDNDRRWPLRLAKMVRSGDYDIIHVHSPMPGSIARLAARSKGRRRPKIVTTEHNAWGTFVRPTRWLNRLTSRWNDSAFAVSDEVRDSMHGGSGGAVPVTLAHGIDVAHAASFSSQRSAARAEFGISDDEFVIGTVANFRVQKDYPNLLEAARQLTARGVAARWLIVGQGPLEMETRQLAHTLALGDRSLFTGFRPDAVRVMSAFDVFTLASSWEGLPVALMEALALGLPVVSTGVGGVAEAMEDGVDAILVPPRSATALADAWQRVMTDEGERAALSAAARSRSPEFDVSRAQRAIEAEYLRLVPMTQESPPVEPAPKARTKKAGLDIREATPDDEPAILELLRRSLGWSDDPRFTELYRWKHRDNHFGPSPTWVATDGDRIAAVRIFMRWEFVRDGQVLRAVRAVDTATDPEYQGRGLFTALTMHGLEEMRADGVDFVFNTPNEQSKPGYLKMGWREVGHLPAAVRPIGLGGASRMAMSRVAADHWSDETGIGKQFGEWAESRPSILRKSVPRLDRHLTTRTDEAFFLWRYGFATLDYRVAERDGNILIIRVRRRGKAEELVVLTALAGSLSDGDSLSVALGRKSGSHHVLRLGPPDLRHGFISLPGGGPALTFRALSEGALPALSNWELTMGDVELF